MLSLHATQQAILSQIGQEIIFIVEVTLPQTGKVYFASRDVTIEGQDYLGIISYIGDLEFGFSPTGVDFAWVSDVHTIVLLNLPEDVPRLQDYEITDRLEGAKLEVSFLFWHSNPIAAEKTLLFTGRIQHVSWDTETVSVTAVDDVTFYGQKQLGRLTTRDLHPDFGIAPPESIGVMLPLAFGVCNQVPILPITPARVGFLLGMSVKGSTRIYLRAISANAQDGYGFAALPLPFTVTIGTEEIIVQNVVLPTSTLPGYLVPNKPTTQTHPDNEQVVEKRGAYYFLVCDGVAKSVTNLQNDGHPVTDVSFSKVLWPTAGGQITVLKVNGIPEIREVSGGSQLLEYNTDDVSNFFASFAGVPEKPVWQGGGTFGFWRVLPESSCTDTPWDGSNYADFGAIDVDEIQKVALLNKELIGGRPRRLLAETGHLNSNPDLGQVLGLFLCVQFAARPLGDPSKFGLRAWDHRVPVFFRKSTDGRLSWQTVLDASLDAPMAAPLQLGRPNVSGDLGIFHYFYEEEKRVEGTQGLFAKQETGGATAGLFKAVPLRFDSMFSETTVREYWLHDGTITRNLPPSGTGILCIRRYTETAENFNKAVDGDPFTYARFGEVTLSDYNVTRAKTNSSPYGLNLEANFTDVTGDPKYVKVTLRFRATNQNTKTISGAPATYVEQSLGLQVWLRQVVRDVDDPNPYAPRCTDRVYTTRSAHRDGTPANQHEIVEETHVLAISSPEVRQWIKNGGKVRLHVAAENERWDSIANNYYTITGPFDLHEISMEVFDEQALEIPDLVGLTSPLQSELTPWDLWIASRSSMQTQKFDLRVALEAMPGMDLTAKCKAFLQLPLQLEIDFNSQDSTTEIYLNRVWLEIQRIPVNSRRSFGQLTCDVQGYETGGNLIRDPIGVLDWLISYMGMDPALMDSTSHDATQADLLGRGYAFSNYLTNRVPVVMTITEVLKQSAVRMYQSGGKFFLRRLEKHIDISSPTLTIANQQKLNLVLSRNHPSVDQISNEIVVRYGKVWKSGLFERSAIAIDLASQALSWGKQSEEINADWLEGWSLNAAQDLAEIIVARKGDHRPVVGVDLSLQQVAYQRGDSVLLSSTRDGLTRAPGEIVGQRFIENATAIGFSVALDLRGKREWEDTGDLRTYVLIEPGETGLQVVIYGKIALRLTAEGDIFQRGKTTELESGWDLTPDAGWTKIAWNASKEAVDIHNGNTAGYYDGIRVDKDGNLSSIAVYKEATGPSGGSTAGIWQGPAGGKAICVNETPKIEPIYVWNSKIWITLQNKVVAFLGLMNINANPPPTQMEYILAIRGKIYEEFYQ